ncbi:hypothetical protein Tco_0478966 [Tanacetum coccineum]
MASVTIQQDTSITPPMTSPVIDLVSRPHSPNVHWPLPTTTITTAATTTTTLPLPPQLQQGIQSESRKLRRKGANQERSGTTGASILPNVLLQHPPFSSTSSGKNKSTGTARPKYLKDTASAEYSAWTTTDSQTKPSITQIPDDPLLGMKEYTVDVQVLSSDDEVGRDHVPTVNLSKSWWKPLTEDRPSTPEPAWTIPSSDRPCQQTTGPLL